MDMSNLIGGPSWSSPSLRPLGNGSAPAPAAPEAAVPSAPTDQLDIQGSVAPVEPEKPAVDMTPAAPAPSAPRAVPAEAVPVNMLAEDVPILLGGESNCHPAEGLGIMAQLEDIAGVRAIDDQPRTEMYRDLSLIGPANAAQYLGRAGEMYLGI